MPCTNTLTKRLARLRGAYTGEPEDVGRGEAVATLPQLTTRDRTTLLAALDVRPSTALPSTVRRVVLPDAATTGQRELEAGIAAAVARAHATGARTVIRFVTPLEHSLVLHVRGRALQPLLNGLLPHTTNTGFTGIPGLRATVHRRHVQLYLVGTDPAATVWLAGVQPEQWATIVTRIGVELPGPTLTPAERAVLDLQHHHAPGPARLLSALLRRPRLWTGTTRSRLTTVGCTTAVLTWPPGTDLAVTARRLLHPIVGLPAHPWTVHRYLDGVALFDGSGHVCDYHHPVASMLVLRSRQAPTPPQRPGTAPGE